MTWLRSHWKSAICLVLICAAYVGGFWTAHGLAPDKVTESSHVAEVTHTEKTEDVKAAVEIEEKTVKIEHRTIRAHTVTTKPDGTKVDRTVETTDQLSTDTKAAAASKTEDKRSEDSHIVRTEDRLKVTEYRRDWMAGVLVGSQLKSPVVLGSSLGGLTFAVQAQRRLNFIPIPVAERAWLGVVLTVTPGVLLTPGSHPLSALTLLGSLSVEF